LKKDIPAGSIYAVGIDDAIMLKRIEQHHGKIGNRSIYDEISSARSLLFEILSLLLYQKIIY